ncbi:MAG TPA: DHHA1 domain-containing protein [Rhodanobacteraceae bacterium]|nr:DHHA1 domain-containing protein [Rhodanobacteraceae bacterium]
MLDLQTPRVLTRALDPVISDQARAEGFSSLQQRILSARFTPRMIDRAGGRVAAAVAPSLQQLTPPATLPDIDIAARRIADAIVGREHTILCLDHDCDGLSAAKVLYSALVDYFGASPDHVHLYTTERLSEGYGFSLAYLERVCRRVPDVRLIITADQGSSDETTIREALRKGISTIVSDHHILPTEGPPRSALACVSPARHDAAAYGDPMIAGCMVAWLLMCQVRRELIARGTLSASAPSLAPLLQAVALGTTADAVSLGESVNNRAVVVAGLARMNGPSPMPGLSALRAISRRDPLDASPLTATHLAWDIAPRLAGVGRLDSAMPGARLLLARTDKEAAALAAELDEANRARREIQAELLAEAMMLAQAQVDAGACAIVIPFPEGHPGVHGVVAGRLAQRFGRPTVCLSPKRVGEGLYSGSVRSVPGFHARDALIAIRDRAPDGAGIRAAGGHAAAAGVTVEAACVGAFGQAFEAQARDRLAGKPLGPWFDVDGGLPAAPSMALLEEIEALGPYGRGFEAPLFELQGQVLQVRPMGQGQHLRVTLHADVGPVEFVWFNARSVEHTRDPLRMPPQLRAIVSVSRNVYRGKASAQLIAEAVMAAEG